MSAFKRNMHWLMLAIIAVGCQPKSESKKDLTLGEIQFNVTGNEDAQSHFTKGLLLLHSFEYKDAEEAFVEAQKADPEMLMAYWGEAMTHNHPLWSQQNYEKGKYALDRLTNEQKEVLKGKVSAVEWELFQSAEILFGEGEKFDRDQAYSDHLGKLHDQHPDNHEVSAFYALSLLGSSNQGRDYELYGKGAKIAKSILNENPGHPGALHYLIHAYDDPDHAPLALEAANNYAGVAPDAGHALHMPSHIYVAIGMWEEVILSNIASYEARLKKIERKRLNPASRNYHAYHWLLYGHLQLGHYEEAKAIMRNMAAYAADTAAKGGLRYYAIEMKGIYLAETGDWDSEFADLTVNTEDLNIQSQASLLFLDGMKAYQQQDKNGMKEAMQQIEDAVSVATGVIESKGVTVCSGVGFASRLPDQDDLNQAEILLMELKAMYAKLEADKEGIEKWLKSAVDLEDKTSYEFGPPNIVFPSYELYGNWLVEEGRAQEALALFDKALIKGPNRISALKGKLAAATHLNDTALIEALTAKIEGRTPKNELVSSL
ncbi:MAG: hypothetical protein AAFX87_10040 [Bacteroidota bacterium]